MMADTDGDDQAELIMARAELGRADAHSIQIHDPVGCRAFATNYGMGWPGTFGVPDFEASAPPVLGDTITLDIGNSLGAWTVGLLFVGFSQAEIPTSAGGDLLVAPPWILTTVGVPPWGLSLPVTIPADLRLLGFEVDLQVITLDPGASESLSFSPGLHVHLGER